MTTRIVYFLLAALFAAVAVGVLMASAPATPTVLLVTLSVIMTAILVHDGLKTDRRERFIS